MIVYNHTAHPTYRLAHICRWAARLTDAAPALVEFIPSTDDTYKGESHHKKIEHIQVWVRAKMNWWYLCWLLLHEFDHARRSMEDFEGIKYAWRDQHLPWHERELEKLANQHADTYVAELFKHSNIRLLQ